MLRYDIIGDVHGNAAQLRELLLALGYGQPKPRRDPNLWIPPEDRRLIFVGDIVDRGPSNLESLRIVMRMARDGHARMVLGNHDYRMIEILRGQLKLGKPPSLALGRLMTWVELLGATDEEKHEMLAFLEEVPMFLELDEGRLLVVHARWDNRFRRFEGDALLRACAFGRTEWNKPEGPREPGSDARATSPYIELEPSAPLKERARWTRGYAGSPLVVWGHQIVRREAVVRVGNTVNVESGCFVGHALSAYLYPEGEVVQVHSAVPWKTRIHPYMALLDTVYPRTLDWVTQMIRDERLVSAEDYLAWIELVLEENDAPALSPEHQAIHRSLFARATADGGR